MVDYSLYTTIFQNGNFIGRDWIIPLIVILLSMVMVTRDTQKWKSLYFPMMTAWFIAGLQINILLFVTSAIYFVIEGLSTQSLSKIYDMRKRITEKFTLGGLTQRGLETRALKHETYQKAAKNILGNIYTQRLKRPITPVGYIKRNLVNIQHTKQLPFKPKTYLTPEQNLLQTIFATKNKKNRKKLTVKDND